jgi:hypothetical protein
MGEQQSQASTTETTEKPANAWGQSIGAERQAQLAELVKRQREWLATPETQRGFSAFKGVPLTGADVFWLAQHSRRDNTGRLRDFNLDGANLVRAHLAGANLFNASLKYVSADSAIFDGADLTEAQFIGAYLGSASMKGASMSGIRLDGAFVRGAILVGANLRTAMLDRETSVLGVQLVDRRDKRGVSPRFADIRWGDADVDRIDWAAVKMLGDDVIEHKPDSGNARTERHRRVGLVSDAVRANRQIATLLRGRGLNDDADRFAYRAQVLQRRLYLRRIRILRYLGSLFLDLISGYGYRPIRSLFAYVLVIFGFAAAYFFLGGANGQSITANEAIVISMTAFHGRGFFSAVFQPGDLQAAVAAVEAFIGLLIEIVLIATFTQRFFAR